MQQQRSSSQLPQSSPQSKISLTKLKAKQPITLKLVPSIQQSQSEIRRIHSLSKLRQPPMVFQPNNSNNNKFNNNGLTTGNLNPTQIIQRDIIQHQLFDHHVVQNNMKIQGELKRLQVAFVHQKVPEFYAYGFMNRLVHASEDKIQDKILKQLQQVKTKRSFYHVISNAIKARQACLKQLQRCLQNLFNNQDDNLTKHVFREQITHYRKLTGFVVAHIRAWKIALNQISPELYFTTFLYQGEDYLLKLLNDCEFIFNSFLTRHLKFSYKNDPYIMRPFLDGRQSKYLSLFAFTEQQKGLYMGDLNYLASERTKYLQFKMNSKSEKIKDIQKIYHSDMPITSRIIVRKIPSGHKKGQSQDNKEKQSDGNQVMFDNFMKTTRAMSEKKLRIMEINKNTDKIKQIKQTYGNKIINQNMFESVSGNQNLSPYEQKLKYTSYQPKKDRFQMLNYQSDFQNLLRKKEVDVLKGGDTQKGGPSSNLSLSGVSSMDITKTQRSFKNIKIRDSLSDSRKFLTNQQGFSELEKILNQLDTYSPQKLQSFKLRKKQKQMQSPIVQDSPVITLTQSKSKSLIPQKTLLQHNEQVYVNVRNQVISEIEHGLENQIKNQQKRKQQNEQIQNILQKKINQQSMRIIKNTREKQLQGREHLAKQMGSQKMFGYDQNHIKNSQKLTQLQEDLRKQMRLKWLREVQQQLKRKTQLNEINKIKQNQQNQLDKKLQKVKQKQQLQKRYEQIQRQQKAKIIQKQLQLQQQRKKQIQQQMRIIIQRQKASMQRLAAVQKSQVQQQLKLAMKEQMLENIRQQNQKYYDDDKKQQERIKSQREYREQARAKIQEEYKVGQQLKKNRERQQKLAKIKLVKQKLGQIGSPQRKITKSGETQKKQQEKLQAKLEQLKIKSSVPQFRESLLPKVQKNTESEKKKLRDQFEIELFSFKKAQNNQTGQNQTTTVYQEGKIPIKDYRTIIDEKMKQNSANIIKQQQNQQKSKIQGDQANQNLQTIQIKKNKSQPVQQKYMKSEQKIDEHQQQIQRSMHTSLNSQKFTKFSQRPSIPSNINSKQLQQQQQQLIRLKLGMSPHQYQVYKKKKNAINARRDIQQQANKRRIIEEKKEVVRVIDQFQKMDDIRNSYQQKKQEASVVNINLYTKENQQSVIDNFSANNQNQAIQKSNSLLVVQNMDGDFNENVQIDQRKSPRKSTKKDNDIQILTINSKISLSQVKQKRFQTENQDDQSSRYIKRKSKPKPKKQKRKHSPQQQQQSQFIQQQQQVKQRKSIKQSKKPAQQQLIVQPKKPSITAVKFRQIPTSSLSQFFTDHFQHLPRTIKKLNIYKKQQLIKFLLQHSSFSILQYIKQSISLGLAIVLYNQNKQKYRSLNIVHLGSYDQQDYLQVMINVARYCFKIDPCQEIAMANVYEREDNQQWEFIKQFQKKFDPYGAIFQKKIFNTQFQRKFVIRRNIGQVCKIQPVPQYNRGMMQLTMNTFVVQSKNQQNTRQLVQADSYEELGFDIGFYGIIANYLLERYSQQCLAYIIAKSTEKDASMSVKNIASLGKLALAMKKHPKYLRLSELSSQQFDNIMNLNLSLLSKHQQALPYDPQSIQNPLKCTHLLYKTSIQLAYDFYSQTIPIKIHDPLNQIYDQQYLCKYLRYTPNKKNKMFTLKSSAYSTTVTVLPCKDYKSKVIVLDCAEYQQLVKKGEIQGKGKMEIGVYLRVLLANVGEHQVANYDHVWMPQIDIKSCKNQLLILQQFTNSERQSDLLHHNHSSQQHAFTSAVIRSSLNITYTDYLGNSLKLQPTHRDLVITPPFILAVLDMQIQSALQGSPVFVVRVGKKQMSWVKEVRNNNRDD